MVLYNIFQKQKSAYTVHDATSDRNPDRNYVDKYDNISIFSNNVDKKYQLSDRLSQNSLKFNSIFHKTFSYNKINV